MAFRDSQFQGIQLEAVLAELVVEQGWKRDPRVLLEKPLSHQGHLPQGTMIDASVNLLQTSFTECFREIHFNFS